MSNARLEWSERERCRNEGGFCEQSISEQDRCSRRVVSPVVTYSGDGVEGGCDGQRMSKNDLCESAAHTATSET